MNTLIKNLLSFSTIVSILIISSCATLTDDIEINTQSDENVNYSNYKTYAWAGSEKIVYDPIGQWEQPTLDTDEEVKYIVNRELRKHGMHQVETNPDLFVAYAAGVDTSVLELREDPNHDKEVLTNVPKAALVIALIDAKTGYTVWLGYAVGDVQQQRTIDDIRERIDYAVSEILAPFRP